jgi:hypothetical protein
MAPIVEGHGEVEALPALLHRIRHTTEFTGVFLVNPPIRVKSGAFLNDQAYFRKHVTLATGKAAELGGSVIRNAKGWLGARMNVPYDQVIHQLEFTRAFDLEQARANRSFNRLYCRIRTFLDG